ncbi:MAG: hypothetical protein BWY05_01204 [Euryarchaeota archaeon ADurb.Bin165]|nr:MAG: hypothetical protein BWY05_01204 [Euryarchaeota archaeon ADurb.Bin165]
MEQVNRHALPQFCRKIEAELKGSFSDDDELFYQEVAGLINGCFKAYRGPGRYLHHIYPEEVKIFRQTLDQMGHELNRMTDIIRISRERLTHISDMRTFIEEKNALEEENLRSDEDLQKYETRLHELDGELAKAQAELEKILASDIYASYLRLEEDTGQQGRQLEKLHESWESQIRIAIPVWKRSAKAFQEQGRTEDEKKMEELIHLASSPRRDDEKVAGEVSSTAESLFSLFDSGTLQAKNSFEKQLFTSAEEYTKRFNEVFTGLHALSADLDAKMQDLNANPAMEQKNRAAQEIGDVKRKIDDLNREEEKRKERLSSLAERKESVLEDLKKSFSEFAGEETDLVMDGKEQ